MDSESNKNSPFFSGDEPHTRLYPKVTEEYLVYGTKVRVIDPKTGRIEDNRDIVYKELKQTRKKPKDVTLVGYAKALKDLYTIVQSHYPEVVNTNYVIAKNREDKPCILAIQPFQDDLTAYNARIMDPGLGTEIEQKTVEFKERWRHVTEDPRWEALPDYLKKIYTRPDFNTDNFFRSREGEYKIVDW